LCKKSIIKAPPAQGQGTVVWSKCAPRTAAWSARSRIDNQEGDYEFLELPPLESMTVAVVEHSDPDIKPLFSAGRLHGEPDQNDTIIDFIYFAPPEVEIASGLDPVPGCSPEVHRAGQRRVRHVEHKQYVATMSDDGVCYLDTANFRIINGFSDEVLDTVMSGGS
jgi:hypothetical protein